MHYYVLYPPVESFQLAQAIKRLWQANTHSSISMRISPCASITMISSVCPHAPQTDTSNQEPVEPYLFLSLFVSHNDKLWLLSRYASQH